jgi:hypothetical protein
MRRWADVRCVGTHRCLSIAIPAGIRVSIMSVGDFNLLFLSAVTTITSSKEKGRLHIICCGLRDKRSLEAYPLSIFFKKNQKRIKKVM